MKIKYLRSYTSNLKGEEVLASSPFYNNSNKLTINKKYYEKKSSYKLNIYSYCAIFL
jgi:hypothetical protein